MSRLSLIPPKRVSQRGYRLPRVVITKGAKFRKELVFTDVDIITIGRANTSTLSELIC